jgi:hypothetical protein
MTSNKKNAKVPTSKPKSTSGTNKPKTIKLKKTTAADQRRRVTNKKKSKERLILEQLEGEEFDTDDFKLITDLPDDE